MLKIAVCDDEEITRESIKKILCAYAYNRNIKMKCDEYADGKSLADSRNRHDIIILDFKLDALNEFTGIHAAKKLRDNGNEAAIIFLSSYPNKAVLSSFEVDTFRFLVKPLDSDKLFKALDDYLKLTGINQSLLIKQDGEIHRLGTKQIMFLEGAGKYCTLFMSDKSKVECHETLRSVEERLPVEAFYRCHRSYIVNLKYVQNFSRSKIILTDKKSILISRDKYDLFQAAFMEYNSRFGF